VPDHAAVVGNKHGHHVNGKRHGNSKGS